MLCLLGKDSTTDTGTFRIPTVAEHAPRITQTIRVYLWSHSRVINKRVVRGYGILQTVVFIVDINANDLA